MFMRLHGRSRTHLRLIKTFFLGALQFATPTQAQEIRNPCEWFGMNEATFIARVSERVQHRFTAAPDVPAATLPAYPAVVERGFRGVATGSTVHVVTFDKAQTLQNGQQYLIYGAFFGVNREVVTPMRIVPIDDAGADLDFLTSQAALLATTGRIYGRVQRGSIYGEANRQPVPEITLHVRVGDFVTETVSDADGRFDVAGLPEGYFKIAADLPPELTTGWTGGGEVRAGGCVPTGVVAQWNGIIRGRLMGADQHPVQTPVHLLPADARTEGFPREGQVKFSSTSGEFEFSALPPGDYLLGVGLDRLRTGSPYPPTYYPGTTNREEARLIHVGEGTAHENVDLALPPALAHGRLFLRPSTPASGIVSVCIASAGGSRQSAPGEPVIAHVIEGVRYRLRLHIEETAGKHWESDVVEVVGQPGDHEMVVTVSHPARPHPENSECYNEALSDSK